jgi:hypothetical protein
VPAQNQPRARRSWSSGVLVGVALAAAFAGGFEWREKTGSPGAAARESESSVAHSADEDPLDARLQRIETALGRLSAILAERATNLKNPACAVVMPEKMSEVGASSAPPFQGRDEGKRTERSIQAEQAGEAIVERAALAGRWTTNDRDQLRIILGTTDDLGHFHLITKLDELIGSKRVTLDGLQGPPL